MQSPQISLVSVRFSDDTPGVANRQTAAVTYTLEFDAPVFGLEASDFLVDNGTVGTVSGAGERWTVSVVPRAGVPSGAIQLTLVEGAVRDLLGNPNAQAIDASQAIDTFAPVSPKLVTDEGFDALIQPRVSLRTSAGTIVIELFPDESPLSTANLLAYVNADFYDGIRFHRVEPGFVIQTGGFAAGLQYRAPLYAPVPLEVGNGLSNLRGTVGMARTSGLDTATSQFYFNLADNIALDTANGGYAVVGRVVSGLSVMDAIAAVPTAPVTVGGARFASAPVTDVVIDEAVQSRAGYAVSTSGAFQVSGLEIGARWAFSIDGGATWVWGSGTRLEVPDSYYDPLQVRIAQIDGAGNWTRVPLGYTSALLVERSENATDDTLIGGEGNDLLAAMGGDDLIEGRGGGDLLDGGAGTDTAAYGVALSTAVIELVGDGLPPHDARVTAPGLGTDTLSGIERLRFTDFGYALDVLPGGDVDDPVTKGEGGNAGKAYRLYQAALARQPDLEGLGYWISVIDSGASLYDIATGFLSSPEFQSAYGSDTNDRQFLEVIYRNVLGRDYDQAGFDWWLATLGSGATTRQQVLVDFSESEENKENLLELIGNGFAYLPWEAG